MLKYPTRGTIKGHNYYSLLWLAEHFCYSEYFKKRRAQYAVKIANRLPAVEDQLLPVPEVHSSDINTFIKDYRDPGVPVVLRGLARDWESVKKWTPDYLAECFPEDQVILFDASIKSKTDDTIKNYDVHYKSLLEFVESMNNGSKEYARFLPLLDNHPELFRDFDMNFLNAAAGARARQPKRQLFMGGPNTSTSMHAALGSNLFVQVHGQKRWWIYSAKESSLLEPAQYSCDLILAQKSQWVISLKLKGGQLI